MSIVSIEKVSIAGFCEGPGRISSDDIDVTRQNGNPAACRVTLWNPTRNKIVAQQISNSIGEFSFEGLKMDVDYTIIIYDGVSPFTAKGCVHKVRAVLP